MGVPNRANSRGVIRVGQRPARRSGVVSSAEIEAAVKASGIQDDDHTTGPMGIRDTQTLRGNASELLKKKKK